MVRKMNEREEFLLEQRKSNMTSVFYFAEEVKNSAEAIMRACKQYFDSDKLCASRDIYLLDDLRASFRLLVQNWIAQAQAEEELNYEYGYAFDKYDWEINED